MKALDAMLLDSLPKDYFRLCLYVTDQPFCELQTHTLGCCGDRTLL